MTGMFDRLSRMAKDDRPRFEKITLKIIDYVMVKTKNDKNWQGLEFILDITDADCNNPDCFVEYLHKLSRLIKGEDFLTGYRFLDYAWPQYPDHDFLNDFVDNFHDWAHHFRKRGLIKTDGKMFGEDIQWMVG